MLTEGNIRLRAVEPTDVDVLFIWENDPSVWTVSQTISPFSMYSLKEYCEYAKTDFQSAKQLRLMIDFIESGKSTTVGAVDLFDYDAINRRAGIGILIGQEKFRKQGIANTTIKIVCNYAFTVLNLHQLHCYVSEENTASISLFTKSGFVSKGKINDWLLQANHWKNVFFLQKINK